MCLRWFDLIMSQILVCSNFLESISAMIIHEQDIVHDCKTQRYSQCQLYINYHFWTYLIQRNLIKYLCFLLFCHHWDKFGSQKVTLIAIRIILPWESGNLPSSMWPVIGSKIWKEAVLYPRCQPFIIDPIWVMYQAHIVVFLEHIS